MTEKLQALKPTQKNAGKRSITAEEGIEIIRAYRRGVSLEALGKAMGRDRAAVYARLGTWALRHAALPEDNER